MNDKIHVANHYFLTQPMLTHLAVSPVSYTSDLVRTTTASSKASNEGSDSVPLGLGNLGLRVADAGEQIRI
jgi:hypothetical protein